MYFNFTDIIIDDVPGIASESYTGEVEIVEQLVYYKMYRIPEVHNPTLYTHTASAPLSS